MFNSNLSRNSGVMSVIMNYYRNINRDEVQFDFMYFRESEASYNEEIELLGGRCFYVSKPSHYLTFMRQLNNFFAIHREYQIVHIHDAIFAKLMYTTLKKNGVKSVIVHSHATRYSDKKISEIRNKIICKNISKSADILFACSDAAGKFMFGEKKFFVMKNAIEVDKYSFSQECRINMRDELDLDGKCVVGHIGAFVNQKNHKFLLKIFKEILNYKPNAALLLAGDGPLFDEIQNYAKELEVFDKVLFLGKRKDTNRLYQAMDVFVLPSLYEGLPMVGVEAQCAGLPVVFSSEITKEIGIGEHLFLPLSDSAKKWASKVIEILEESKDRDRSSGVKNLVSAGFDIKCEAINVLKQYSNYLGE